jgi:predicted dehydrogenase
MKKFKVAIIGNGGRSISYGKAFSKCNDVEVVALCDQNQKNTITMAKMSNISDYIYYSDYLELHEKHQDLDGVVIVTPNHLHREMAIPFIERGMPIALEKPITTTMRDSEIILLAAKKYKSRLLIGFVLRSAPFYKKVDEMLKHDLIGPVLTIQADELGSYGVSSIICRSPWRRYQASSGGSLMEKSSHDMDLINWFSNGRPLSVNSYGGNLLFRPNPNLPVKCIDCKHKDCPYYGTPEFSPSAGDAVLQDFAQHRDAEQFCIYNIDKDVADNQSVSIEYSNGVIANFMLSFNCSGERSGRNLHIVGTKGRIWGNIEDNQLYVFENNNSKVTKIELGEIESGHSGGDEGHALELVKMMRDKNYTPDQDDYAGYLSNAICIAADLSRVEKRRINFRYDTNNFITFN